MDRNILICWQLLLDSLLLQSATRVLYFPCQTPAQWGTHFIPTSLLLCWYCILLYWGHSMCVCVCLWCFVRLSSLEYWPFSLLNIFHLFVGLIIFAYAGLFFDFYYRFRCFSTLLRMLTSSPTIPPPQLYLLLACVSAIPLFRLCQLILTTLKVTFA